MCARLDRRAGAFVDEYVHEERAGRGGAGKGYVESKRETERENESE